MRRKLWAGIAIAVLLVPVGASAATKTYVLPVVVKGVTGADGSYWDSEVRIISRKPDGPVKVRRAWVATKDGGFLDSHNPPLYKELPPWGTQAGYTYRMIILRGLGLMNEVPYPATHAAIGLEVDGEADIYLRNANTEGQPRLPSDVSRTCCLPGNGQLIKAATEYLQGESYIPWVTAGTEAFRTNLGFINPSDKPLHLRVKLMALQPALAGVGEQDMATPYWYEIPAQGYLPEIVVDLPPWGWRQLNDVFKDLKLCDEHNVCAPSPLTAPSYAQIVPEGTGPYLAYASVVYSPKNDPEFIWAEPGSLGPLPTSAK